MEPESTAIENRPVLENIRLPEESNFDRNRRKYIIWKLGFQQCRAQRKMKVGKAE